jgi:hypothetical protein
VLTPAPVKTMILYASAIHWLTVSIGLDSCILGFLL